MRDSEVGALLENIESKLDRLAESIADVPADVRHLKTDVAKLQEDVTAIKAAVTDQSGQLQRHEVELKALKAA